MIITEKIVDTLDGSETIIERELSTQELQEFEEAARQANILKKEFDKKVDEKKALLEKLGITSEEAKLLLS